MNCVSCSREEISKRWKAACRKLEMAGSMVNSGSNLNCDSAEVAERTFMRLVDEAEMEIDRLKDEVVCMCREIRINNQNK